MTLYGDGASNNGQITITSDVSFDTILFEGETGSYETGEGYRVLSAEIVQTEEGYDQTIIVPFEVTDADGDTVSEDFSVTFDGDGNLDATLADSLDDDVSTSGMVISGNGEADNITGTDYADTIYGHGGNDTIDGGDGDDTIYGGDGDDTIYGGDGNDFIVGDLIGESVDGPSSEDTIDGGAGDDVIIGGDGLDTLEGGADSDVLVGDIVDFTDPENPVIVEDGETDIIDGGAIAVAGDIDSDVAGNAQGSSAEDVNDATVVEPGDPGGDDLLDHLIPPPVDPGTV